MGNLTPLIKVGMNFPKINQVGHVYDFFHINEEVKD